MNDETQQAVVENQDAGAQPPATGTDAQDQKSDPWEDLLSQYDQDVGQARQQQQTDGQQAQQPDSELQQRLDSMERQLESTAATNTRRDMAELVGKVRGDSTLFDDATVEAWLDGQARQDPRLAQAWMDRHNNPRAFDRIADQLSSKWQEQLKSIPDQSVTEDRMAVAAAVKGASKSGSSAEPEIDEEKVRMMSDAEFESYKKRLARQMGY